jgi:hypothetical protein
MEPTKIADSSSFKKKIWKQGNGINVLVSINCNKNLSTLKQIKIWSKNQVFSTNLQGNFWDS